MDKIELKSTDIEPLLEWRDRHADLVRSAPAPLKSVEIIITDNGFRIKGIRDGDRLRLTLFHRYKKLIDLRAGYETSGLMKMSKKQLVDGMKEENVQTVVTVYASLMALMTFGVRYEEPKEVTVSRSTKKPQTARPTPKRKPVTYILRRKGNDLFALPTGSHASPSGIFTVRGHYRHYKNGKVVWISEYKKGTGKKKKKTYKIGGNPSDEPNAV